MSDPARPPAWMCDLENVAEPIGPSVSLETVIRALSTMIVAVTRSDTPLTQLVAHLRFSDHTYDLTFVVT